MGGQGVHCQDAFVRKAPLTARDERCQELAICRNVTAGIIVDLAVLHQHIHGGCSRRVKKKEWYTSQGGRKDGVGETGEEGTRGILLFLPLGSLT